MYPGSLPFVFSLLTIAALTAGMAVYAFRHRRQPGAVVFGWLTVSMTLWSVFYALELFAPTLPLKVLAAKLEYLAIPAVPVLWFVFALIYTGHSNWLTPLVRFILFFLPITTFALVLTNENHHFIYKGLALDALGFSPLVVTGYGFWFWVHVAISYTLVLAGVSLYWVSYFQARHIFRRQMNVMVFGSLLPFVVNALRLFTPIPLHGLDITPFTFAFSGILLSIGIFRLRLIDMTPIAAPLVMENLQDAVIVVDASHRIMDMNPAAVHWFDASQDAIGDGARERLSVLQPVWENLQGGGAAILLNIKNGHEDRWLDISVSPLRNSSGGWLGSVIIARDKTREHTLLIEERRHARQMEILNAITLASLKTDTLQDTLRTLADHLNELLEADGVFLTLWNEEKRQVLPVMAYGEFRDAYKKMKLDPEEVTLTASVLSEGRPLAIEDVRNTPYMDQKLAADVPTQSVLALPLIADDEKLGAALISFNQAHHFSAEEISLGSQAAAQIALALKKNKLLETVSRRMDQLNLIQEVSRQMTASLDEREICKLTVQAILQLFGYDEAAISLLRGNQLEITAVGGAVDFGFSPGFRQYVGQGIMGYVAEIQRAYFSEDITRDPHYYHPESMGRGSALGTPILYEGMLLGVIYIQSEAPNPILTEDLPIMQTLASHLATAIQKARLYADVQSHLTSMTTLQSVTETVTSSLELDKVLKTVVQLLKEAYGYSYVSIYLLDGSVLKLGAQAGYPEELVIYEIPITEGITGRTVCTGQPQFISNVHAEPNFLLASYEVESEICVPLLKDGHILGILNIESASAYPLTGKDMSLLVSFASPVAMAVDNARLHARVTSLAMTDGMTGLYNRRAFDQFLETEINRAERYQHELSLIILDMDSFKEFNDTYGHPAGDERLKSIASILLENIRNPDAAARYGGEEFAIILPHTTKEGAVSLAERLRAFAEAQSPKPLEDGYSYIPGYTISLGVATFPADSDSVASLLLAADQAELAAKRFGKNRVCTATPLENLS